MIAPFEWLVSVGEILMAVFVDGPNHASMHTFRKWFCNHDGDEADRPVRMGHFLKCDALNKFFIECIADVRFMQKGLFLLGGHNYGDRFFASHDVSP